MATICRDAVQQWGGRILIVAHVKELLEQAVEKLHVMAPDLWMQIGVYSAGLKSRDTNKPITVAGIQSVYKRAAELDTFDLVLIDECFPADTTISTPRGDIPIEEIYVGQPVHTALGVGNVEVISGRTTDRLIEMEFEHGYTIRCTPNHRFFTEQGWREAEALEVGSRLFRREDVQTLRHGNAPSGLSQPGRHSEDMHIRKGVGSSDVLLRKMRGPEEAETHSLAFSETAFLEIGANPFRKEDMPLLRERIPSLAQDRRGGQQPLAGLPGRLCRGGFRPGRRVAGHGREGRAPAAAHQAVRTPEEQAIDDPAEPKPETHGETRAGVSTLRLRSLPRALHPPGLGGASASPQKMPPLRAADDDV